MTQVSGSSCSACVTLTKGIRDQLKAFEVLASLSASLSWTVLKKNLEQLLDQHDKNQDTLGKVKIVAPKEIQIQPMEVVIPQLEETNHQAQEERKVFKKPRGLASINYQNKNSPNLSQQLQQRNKRTRGTLKGNWEGQCRQLLDDLWGQDNSFPFRHPVTVPAYIQLIDRPMCLSVIRQNLYEGVYTEPSQFHSDMMQIFHNSRIYNTDPTSSIRVMTCHLERLYESHDLLQGLFKSNCHSPFPALPLGSDSEGHGNISMGLLTTLDKIKIEKIDPDEVQTYEKINLAPNLKTGRQPSSPDLEKKGRGRIGLKKRRKRRIKFSPRKVKKVKPIFDPAEILPRAQSPPFPLAPLVKIEPQKKAIPTKKFSFADRHMKEEMVGGRIFYKCLICSRTMAAKANMKLHVRRVHFGDRVPCPQCNKIVYSTNLTEHLTHCAGHLVECKGAKSSPPVKNSNQIEIGGAKTKTKSHFGTETTIGEKKKRPEVKLKFESPAASKTKSHKKIERELPVTSKNIVVRNPFKNFDLESALNVKVSVQKLILPSSPLNSEEIENLPKIVLNSPNETINSQAVSGQFMDQMVIQWSSQLLVEVNETEEEHSEIVAPPRLIDPLVTMAQFDEEVEPSPMYSPIYSQLVDDPHEFPCFAPIPQDSCASPNQIEIALEAPQPSPMLNEKIEELESRDEEAENLNQPPNSSARPGVFRLIPIVFQKKQGGGANLTKNGRLANRNQEIESSESESEKKQKEKNPKQEVKLGSQKKGQVISKLVWSKYRRMEFDSVEPGKKRNCFECKLCKKLLQHPLSLPRHLRLAHSRECSKCYRIFYDEESLDKHESLCTKN